MAGTQRWGFIYQLSRLPLHLILFLLETLWVDQPAEECEVATLGSHPSIRREKAPKGPTFGNGNYIIARGLPSTQRYNQIKDVRHGWPQRCQHHRSIARFGCDRLIPRRLAFSTALSIPKSFNLPPGLWATHPTHICIHLHISH